MLYFRKLVFTFCLCVIAALSSRADILLSENFASGGIPAGWTTTALQGTDLWLVRNAPAFTSSSGTYYAVFDDELLGAGSIPNEAVLMTPALDCSNRNSVYVRYFHHWFGVENTFAAVEVSNDGGATWSIVMSYEKTTRGSLTAAQDTTLNITAWAANQANVNVRFRYDDGSVAGKFWYLDDITIFTEPDVGITNLVLPDYLGCNQTFGAAETVSVQITNHGVNSVSNIPVSVNVTGGATLTLSGTYVGTIAGGASAVFVLPGSVNMVPDASYQFECYTTLATDDYLLNDTFVDARHQLITTYPFVEDFNANNGGWAAGSSNASIYWEWNTIPATYLAGPAGNGQAWRVVRDGSATYNDMWLESPVFDFTALVNPKLSMDLQYDLTYDWCDRGVFVQYSLNGGTTWTTLGTSADPTWYNAGANTCWPNTWSGGLTTGWLYVQQSLCPLAGESCVKFRIYGDDLRYDDKFTLDNFTVEDSPDVGVTVFVDPVSVGCLYNDQQEVTIAVYNWSCNPLTNVPVTCEITGAVTASLSGTIPGPLPVADTVHYTFAGTFDMTTVGTYNFEAYTSLVSDANNNNDTLTSSIPVTQLKITNFPYTEDFNTTDGYWFAGAGNANNYFTWGTLPGTYLAGSAGQGDSWYLVRDGSATYVDAWIESPVFDFSEVTNPVLGFDLQYDLAYDWCDRAVFVEYSLDGGTTWNTLGAAGDPNWYNAGANTCWPNTWSAGVVGGWTRVKHDLCELSGEDCAKLRIYADDVRFDDKFALDNVLVTDGEGDDLEPVLLYSPDAGNCAGYSGTETIQVLIQNNNCRPLENVPVTFTMTGPNATTFTETVPGPIPAFSRAYYTFAGTADMSLTGTYTLSVTTGSNLLGTGLSYINDTFPSNNTLTEIRYANTPINTYPYATDYQSNNDGWASGSSNIQRYFKRDTMPYVGGSNGYGNSYYVESENTATYTDLWVESPVFDFSGLTNPMLLVDLKYDLSYDWCDRAVSVDYSIDGGTNWTRLGTNAEPGWYNPGANTCWPNTWSAGVDTGWTTMQHTLCPLIDETCVKFRFYGDDLRYLDRFAFDNFRIEDRVDVGVTAFIDPVDVGCLFSGNQQVTIAVYNWSCNDVYNVPVTCDITGAGTATLVGTVPGPIAPDDTVHYTFPSNFSMTTLGTYNFVAYTTFPLDPNPNNDTLATSINVNQLKVDVFPYTEDFNTNDGYWIGTGGDANNYFTWGTLPAGYLAGSSGQGDSWYMVRDGTGTYTDIQLESPVFDFSQVTNPVLKFDLQYDLTYDWCDRAVFVQYSLDGGGTWATLGAAGDPNWYNAGANTCWPNTWSAGVVSGWTQVEHDLCILSGEPCAKLRIYADDVRFSDQFAFDNVIVTDGTGDDLEPVAIFPPDGGSCTGFTSAETLTLLIQNNNCRDLTNVPVTFTMTGPNSTTFNDTIPGPVPAFSRFYYTFPNTLDMSAAGYLYLDRNHQFKPDRNRAVVHQ